MQAWSRALGVGMLLAELWAAPLKADPIFVAINFSITFTPPNPIAPGDPTFGPFTGGLLHVQNDVTPPTLTSKSSRSGQLVAARGLEPRT